MTQKIVIEHPSPKTMQIIEIMRKKKEEQLAKLSAKKHGTFTIRI